MLLAPLHVRPPYPIRQTGSPPDHLGVWWFVSRGTGVVALPPCPFAATLIAARLARAPIGQRLAQPPPRVVVEIGSGVHHLLLLGGRPRGANRVVPSVVM